MTPIDALYHQAKRRPRQTASSPAMMSGPIAGWRKRASVLRDILASTRTDELELCETAATSAHEELAKWEDQDYTPNILARATMACPFPTSPAEDIAKVIACERHAEERR